VHGGEPSAARVTGTGSGNGFACALSRGRHSDAAYRGAAFPYVPDDSSGGGCHDRHFSRGRRSGRAGDRERKVSTRIMGRRLPHRGRLCVDSDAGWHALAFAPGDLRPDVARRFRVDAARTGCDAPKPTVRTERKRGSGLFAPGRCTCGDRDSSRDRRKRVSHPGRRRDTLSRRKRRAPLVDDCKGGSHDASDDCGRRLRSVAPLLPHALSGASSKPGRHLRS
jgi:hypothetical protein